MNISSVKTLRPDSKLTSIFLNRHYRFAQEYVRLNYNGTQAYLTVYGAEYTSTNGRIMTNECAKASASRLLSNVTVLDFIDTITNKALAAAEVTVNSVIARYKTWSEFDPRNVFEWRKIELLNKQGNPYSKPRYKMAFTVKSMEDISEEAWECIQAVSEGRDGFIIKVVDKFKANQELAKYLGLDRKIVENTSNITMHFDKQDANL